MTDNSKFMVQLLEKIGAPLAAAIESVPLQGDDTDTEAAKIMAQMLGQAVQVSIALNTSMNLTESEEQADSTRLAVAAVAAPLLAELYRQNKRVPEEADIKRITKSLEAVLAFSENFTPAADSASRLTTIDHDALLFDKTQISLVVLQTLTPVMGAIAEFPFGQSETKLLQDVADRLQKEAAELAAQSGATDKLGELIILKALARLYTDCHRAETARLAGASDDNRAELSLNPVWSAFETRLAMVEAISGLEGAEQSDASVAPEAPPEAMPETPPVEAVAPTAASAQEAPAAAPAQEAPAAGPMGFFKPGAKADEGGSPAAPDSPAPTPAPETPAPETPATENPAIETPPTESAPLAPSSPTPPSEESAGGGGPMSFFKPGTKKADDAAQE